MNESKPKFLREPSSRENKPELVAYIKDLATKASDLDEQQRLSGPGHVIAMDIAGALAFQGAKGVEGEDWITLEEEPVLFELLQVSGTLDADSNNPEMWAKLFDLTNKL